MSGHVIVLAIVLESQLINHELQFGIVGRRKELEDTVLAENIVAKGRVADASCNLALVLRIRCKTGEIRNANIRPHGENRGGFLSLVMAGLRTRLSHSQAAGHRFTETYGDSIILHLLYLRFISQ